MSRKLLQLFVVGGLLVVAVAATAQIGSAASPNRYASVAANGTLVNGNGVSSVSHTATGQYEVTFTSNVSACAYVSTTVNSGPQALQSFTAGGHLSANGVYVEVKNQGGGLTNGPFDLVVDCDSPGWKLAVVGYTANLVRASTGTTLTHTGVGKYNVQFSSAVKKCAFLATVGDPGNGLVFTPSGVYTLSGSNINSVGIETKNAAGGLADGIPFHLAVICAKAAAVAEIVTNANGLPNRGSALASSFLASTGNYVIATGRDLSTCTVVATRGSVNTAVPFDPATVEITPGPAVNTRGIQVRQLLFFGGALINESFHAAGVC